MKSKPISQRSSEEILLNGMIDPEISVELIKAVTLFVALAPAKKLNAFIRTLLYGFLKNDVVTGTDNDFEDNIKYIGALQEFLDKIDDLYDQSEA